MQKTTKADRKLLQRLLNADTSGRTVQMGDILKHELSPIPLSLTQPSGDMNTTLKAELIGVLTDVVDIPSEVPDADKAREQKKPNPKLIDDQNVPLPLVWSNFISLEIKLILPDSYLMRS